MPDFWHCALQVHHCIQSVSGYCFCFQGVWHRN
nr:MAG TPA_asm: hypothetical protein [Caudoviricetes sp.]